MHGLCLLLWDAYYLRDRATSGDIHALSDDWSDLGAALWQGAMMRCTVSSSMTAQQVWNTIPGASDDISKYDFGLMGACAILGGA